MLQLPLLLYYHVLKFVLPLRQLLLLIIVIIVFIYLFLNIVDISYQKQDFFTSF